MKKYFISANELLLDSFRLAQKIYEQNFKPEFIIGVWRGGAPVGIAVQEYLTYKGIETNHIAIRTSSYTGIDEQSPTIRIHGLDYVIDNVNPEQQLLIVDDVFDSGRSIRAILAEINARAGEQTPRHIKVACPWFKPARNVTDLSPDFYVHTTDDWLVFPHEIVGLGIEEIIEGKGEAIAGLLGD